MKKATSFLLALVMLVGMLPGAALTVSAAGTDGELHAYYTNTDITVDGKLEESGWLADQSVGSTPIAMLCSFEDLYVGLKTSADKATMTVNGVSVVANAASGTVTVGGEAAGKAARSSANGTIEIQIPLNSVGLIYDVAQEVSFAIEVGVDSFNGTALLAERTMNFFENCLNASGKADIAKHLGSNTAELWAEAADNGIHYKTGTLSKDGFTISVPAYTIPRVLPSFDIAKGWDMTFNVDFNDLAIPDQDGSLDRFALTGFFIDMRTTLRCVHGFHADAEGNIYVVLYNNFADAIKPVDTGLNLPVEDVDVRISVNDYFESEVYINGKRVATFPTTSRTVTGDNIMYFNSSTRYREDDSRKNDLVLRDIMVTQAAPNMALDVARLPREGVVNQDGSVSESCWSLNEVIDGVKLGALVDTENLYLALNTEKSSVGFELGEYKINATLGKSPKVALGYTMGSTIKGDGKGSYEIAIPLSLMRLENSIGEILPFTVTSGNNSKTFALSLGRNTLSLTEYVPATDDGLRDATAYLNTDKLTLDGALKENQWYIAYEAAGPATAPAADFGFLWDGKYMYIGGQVFSAAQAETLALEMGGKTISADLVNMTATVGNIYIQGQYFEWRVPLADLGVEQGINVEKDYKISISAAGGTSFIQGKLLFAAKSMVFGDACRDFNSREYEVITADTVKFTKWEQGDGFYNVCTNTEALGELNEAHQHFTSLLNYDGGGNYEFEVDVTVIDLPNIETTIGWRGLCWELREPEFQTRFCLRGDGNGGVVMDYLGNNGPHSIPTGVKFGERAVYTVKVSDKLIASVYVNGEYVGSFPTLDRTKFDIKDNYHMPRLIMQNVNHNRALNADGTLGAVNAYVHDMKMVENIYDDVHGMLESTMLALTEESVLAGNDPDPENATQLNLPSELTSLGLPCQVKWTAVDRATGEIADYVNMETGVVTPGSKPVSFNLTADVSYEGISASKTFIFSTHGVRTTGNVSMILNDVDPRVGEAIDWIRNEFAYFDTTRNSLVFDQGSSKQFNTITLRDLDEVSRVSQQHLGVFISEDGKTYTKVTGWLMHQDGSEYTIYNLNAKARYVKVHTYHDDLEREGEQPGFYNSIRDMISVSNNQYLPGAGGTFAHKAEYAVKTSGKDVPVFISLADLGAKAGQYKSGCADFRFTIGNTTLAHWYNGSNGFYVRVPSAPATITAQWGCSSAVDFSNAENVFEVSYGNVALNDMTATSDFSSHGRPFALSNGDIIAVGRRNNTALGGDLAYVRSTDGGRTFDKVATPIIKDSDWKGRSLGFGGFMYDDQIDRLYIIGYSGNNNDSNDYRLVLSYTDDCAKTWSEPVYLSNPLKDPVAPNDAIVSNMPEDIHRAILYSEGLALKDRDGDGPNVDYVIVYNDTHQKTKVNAMVSVYSKDGGKTWLAGEGEISMPQVDASTEVEDGISEHSFTQLDDGSLHVYCRAQHNGNYYFYEGISYDYGNTWVSDFSKVLASNTSPVTMEYNNDRILLWSSYNSAGQKSYLRAPMHVAYTTDEYKSFEKVIDLTFGTSYDGLYDQYYHFTQPGIAFTKDSKDAFVCFWDSSTYRRHTLNVRATIGFLVEDFDQMLYGNKGGFEDFETTSLKYEGWLKHPGDNFDLSREQSASGLWSMKLDGSQPLYATRQVPSMKSGTVGAKVMVPAGNAADFYMTLKAGYNFNHLQHALASFAVSPDGTISVAYADGNKAVAKVAPGSWNDIAISFDIASGMGKLSVNGKVVGDIALNTSGPLYDETVEDVVREVTAVQFVQPVATGNKASFLYVDDFYATELTSALTRSNGNSFADVKESDWFYNAVNFAVDNGIMAGYNASQFGPNDPLNRAMVVQVLYNKEGNPALNGLKHNFSDVPASQWFNNAVTWGSNRGVVSGFGGGVFKPEDSVTIEQVAVILWNYSHTPGGSGDLNDVGNYSDWAANALRWADGQGILNGVPFTNATEKATRAQTAQMLTNYLRTI